MKKIAWFLLLIVFVLPQIVFGQVTTTVSKVVNPVIKKYVPPVTNTIKANSPATAIKKKSSYDPLVALLQAKLTNLGTDPGPVDGINGTKTVAALKEVQRFFGLNPDGVYGKESQKLFSILPINSSLRTTDPIVAIALKKYVREKLKNDLAVNSEVNNISTEIGATLAKPNTSKTIPFTPNGISQVLSKSLSLPGLAQVSEAVVSGTKLSAKPKILSNGARIALYAVSPSNNLGIQNSPGSILSTNFSKETNSKATTVYVCGVVQKTSTCVPVPFDIANSINSGLITLEQYLTTKYNKGDLCVTCFLDEEGNLGVITGDSPGGNLNIPPTTAPAPAANITGMCMDYPYANTNTASYEITFDKPVKVVAPSGLSMDVIRFYNASGKKISAKYSSTSYGDKTLKFTVPLSAGNSIYFEGEGTVKMSPATKIIVIETGESLNLDILPDVFRLSSPCNTSRSYDVTGSDIKLLPDKLYGGEAAGAPRHNVSIKFDEPISASNTLKLLMNPSDTGGTAIGSLVNDKNTPSDTLMFHFNAPLGSAWDSILGSFAFDPNSGTVKNKLGQAQLLNIPAGQDSTGGTCELKYIGKVCVEWDGGKTVKYKVIYTRDITVKTNGSNSNIQLIIDPLNTTAPTITATLTSFDNKAMFFSAPAQSGLLSDHVGYATLDIKNGASVFTINATLQSLGHTDQGGPADPDLGIFSATCSGEEVTPPSSTTITTVTESCRGDAAWPTPAQEITAIITFSEPVYVTGVPSVKIIRADGNDGATLNYVFGSGTNTLKFTYIVPSPLPSNYNYTKQDFEGDYSFKLPLVSGVSIKTASGSSVNLDGRWTAPPGASCPIPDAPSYDPSDVAVLTCFTKSVTGNAGNKVATFTIGTDKPLFVQGIPKIKAWSMDTNPPAQVILDYISGSVTNKLKFQGLQILQSGVPDESFDFVNINNKFQFQFPNGAFIKTISTDGLQLYPHSIAMSTPNIPECAE